MQDAKKCRRKNLRSPRRRVQRMRNAGGRLAFRRTSTLRELHLLCNSDTRRARPAPQTAVCGLRVPSPIGGFGWLAVLLPSGPFRELDAAARSVRISVLPSANGSTRAGRPGLRLPSNRHGIRLRREPPGAVPAASRGRSAARPASRELRLHRARTTPPSRAPTPRRRAPRRGPGGVEGIAGAARRPGTSGSCRRSRGRERCRASGRSTRLDRGPETAPRRRATG